MTTRHRHCRRLTPHDSHGWAGFHTFADNWPAWGHTEWTTFLCPGHITVEGGHR